MQSFTSTINPGRIIFGRGALAQLGAELESIGSKRALILSTPSQKADAESISATLGDLAAGVFSGAVMHTPVSVTEEAMKAFAEADAHCIVALGGGSTIGLGKAIAWRNDSPQIVVATTYAGS